MPLTTKQKMFIERLARVPVPGRRRLVRWGATATARRGGRITAEQIMLVERSDAAGAIPA